MILAHSVELTMSTAFILNPLPLEKRPTNYSPFTCSANGGEKQRQTLLTSRLSVLPLLVRTARFGWDKFWRLMMSELAPSDKEGRYIRPSTPLNRDPPPLQKESNYALYIGAACQWCHRVNVARVLLGVDLDVQLLNAGEDGLWVLQDGSLLRDVYLNLDSGYVGRYTAPLLVDLDKGGIVSNESADILRLIGNVAGRVKINADTHVWLRPPGENDEGIDVEDMDRVCQLIYNSVNDGVYRCGFATSQKAYEEAETNLFTCLDELEARLTNSRFLCSPDIITEADVRLFPTIFRFDAVYAVLFKACRKSIRHDYPAIAAWMRDIYNLPGLSETCDLPATRENYYTRLFPLNPGGIVPVAPDQDLTPVPQRSGLGLKQKAA